MNRTLYLLAFVCMVGMGCGGSKFTIGGTTHGLSGTVILQNNGGDNLSVSAGSFMFPTGLFDGDAYTVSVLTNPSGQTCTASSNTGTVSGANVTSVLVTCSSSSSPIPTPHSYTVGGTVTGLGAGKSAVLQINAADDLTVSTNDSFTFTTPIDDGTVYMVSVLTSPSGQVCTASSNTGTVSGANITSVIVTCSVNSYTVGGTMTGVGAGRSTVLQVNGGDNLSMGTDGSFVFTTPIADGATYTVSVLTNPSGQICSASNNTGTISGANITSVVITCLNAYTVGGTISGLGTTVVLQNNAADNLEVSSNGSFAFTTAVVNGNTYDVSVLTNPAGQTCLTSSNTGTIAGANITSVSVSCSDNPKRIFVTAGTHNGDFATGFSNGIAGADAFCAANLPNGVTGTFKAMLVDFAVRQACDGGDQFCTTAAGNNIDWVMTPNTTYKRIDGTTTIGTTSAAGIFEFWTADVSNGISGGAISAWTGLNTGWGPSFTCVHWDHSDANFGNIGTSNQTTNWLIDQTFAGCNTSLAIYCVEQ